MGPGWIFHSRLPGEQVEDLFSCKAMISVEATGGGPGCCSGLTLPSRAGHGTPQGEAGQSSMDGPCSFMTGVASLCLSHPVALCADPLQLSLTVPLTGGHRESCVTDSKLCAVRIIIPSSGPTHSSQPVQETIAASK